MSGIDVAQVLDEEQAALLVLNHTELMKLLEEKEKILSGSWLFSLSRAEVELLRDKAERNHSLIEAALSGLHFASSLLREHCNSKRDICVYSLSGKRVDLKKIEINFLEKRA